MSEFRAGRIDRSRLGFLKPLAPIQSVYALVDITPEDLIAAGKKLVLVDVDNTMVGWRSEDIPDSTLAWLGFMKSAGLSLCILSNTRHPARLKRLAAVFEIPYLLGKFKPSRAMYRQALTKFNCKPEDAVMVGDQLFTDIFGANRTGIDAIWVKQMTPVDFVGTKVSRFGERLVRRRLYKAIVDESPQPAQPTENDLPVGGAAAFAMLANPSVRQFVKFCIVGGTSTVIDVGLSWYLRFHAPWNGGLLSDTFGHFLLIRFPALFESLSKTPADASFPVFKVISSTLATFNAFLFNRRWTFRIRGNKHRSIQLQKFFVVAFIGVGLNAILTTGLNRIIPGTPKESLAAATAIATILVAFWNFLGQKYWTFRTAS